MAAKGGILFSSFGFPSGQGYFVRRASFPSSSVAESGSVIEPPQLLYFPHCRPAERRAIRQVASSVPSATENRGNRHLSIFLTPLDYAAIVMRGASSVVEAYDQPRGVEAAWGHACIAG